LEKYNVKNTLCVPRVGRLIKQGEDKLYVVVGFRTYAAFYTAWFGSTAQVTFGGDDVFQTNLMMVIQAWHTQNKQNNDAKDHFLFYFKILFTILHKAFRHLG
jgi:hypothetical protein